MQRRPINPEILHSWDPTPQEAKEIQHRLRPHIIQQDAFGDIDMIAGTDVSYDAKTKQARAVIALLSFPDLELMNHVAITQQMHFPYIPGLLSFREVPPLLACFRALKTYPDLILCDGHGVAHPRRFGLACHLGLLLDIPAIGVAKSRLVGEHGDLSQKRGAWQPLIDEGQVIGAAVRSRIKTNPIYVSVGHRVSLDTAIKIVMKCITRYRLPETTRWAHRLSIEKAKK